jgi:hypothetical protein
MASKGNVCFCLDWVLVTTCIYDTMLPPPVFKYEFTTTQHIIKTRGSIIVALLEDQIIGLTFVVVCTAKVGGC